MNTTASMSAVSPNLAIVDGRPVTTSLNVADVFGKQHKDVIRTIVRVGDDAENSEEGFSRRNFAPSSYVDDRGKAQPMYQITRDGFTLLAMGFTGKAAMQFKLAYISAFNAMEAELLEQAAGGSRKTVDFNHYRRTPSPSGLDIRYTLDLTKVIVKPTRTSLELLGRLTGIDVEDFTSAMSPVDVPGNASIEWAKRLESFAADHITCEKYGQIPFSAIYSCLQKWWKTNRNTYEAPPSKIFVVRWLQLTGYKKVRSGGIIYITGLKLVSDGITSTSREVQA